VRVIEKVITIRIEEKAWVPEIPEKYKGRKVISKGFRNFSVNDFPIRELLWQKVNKIWFFFKPNG